MERPEEREFKIADLKEYLAQNRKPLAVAALTILRAYHLAGRPSQNLPAWGGFESWSRLIREAIVWARLPDPCLTRENVIANDPEIEEAGALLAALSEAFGTGGFTAKDVIASATDNPELTTALLSVPARKGTRDGVDPWRLGTWFKKWRDRVVGGMKLQKRGESRRAAQWLVVGVDAKKGESGESGESVLPRPEKKCASVEANRPPGEAKTDEIFLDGRK